MNHIYKIVWNHARACWQVVSELAKTGGKVKAQRRRSRRLAAALALAGCLAAMPGTTSAADGVLRYGDLSSMGQEVFKNWQDGNIRPSGGQFNTLHINIPNTLLRFNYNGADYRVNSSGINSLLTAINSQQATTYNTIVGVVYLPGQSEPLAWTTTIGSGFSSDAMLRELNEKYWETLDVARQLAAAKGDEVAIAALVSAGLPRFYAADDGDWQNGTQLAVGGAGIILGSYSDSRSGNFLQLSDKPSEANYSFSYDDQVVSSGEVWRPLDRLLTVTSGASPLSDDPEAHKAWTIDSSGNVAPMNGSDTASALNPRDLAEAVVTQPTVITVNNLTVGQNSVVDLSYLNTHYDINGNFNPADPIVSHSPAFSTGGWSSLYEFEHNGVQYNRSMKRSLLVNQAVLADGATFRLGVYVYRNPLGANATTALGSASDSDSVYIANAAAADGHANLYVELGWVPGLGTASQGAATDGGYVLGILNGADQFTVSGRTSLADGIFSQYEITPELDRFDNYFNMSGAKDDQGYLIGEQGTLWLLKGYSYFDVGSASESGRSAADNQVVTDNLWRSQYLNVFRRAGSLHRPDFSRQHITPSEPPVVQPGDDSQTLGMASYPLTFADQRENLWADVWHGKYQSSAAYGRKVSQSYNGIQVGFDKQLHKDLYNGKAYAGFFLSKLDSDSRTASGGGDQDSLGLGLYGAWVGNSGHYLDAAVMAAKLKNNYHLTGNTGGGTGRVEGDYRTWAYGLGLQYGYRSPLTTSGWYWEPSAAVFVGRTNAVSYNLSNNLGIVQDEADNVTGRLGLKAGRQLANGKGSIYAGIAALHEFSAGAGLHSFFGNRRMALEAAGGKDTWWEWSAGGKWQISPTGVFSLDLNKTTGSSVGNDWSISGGLNWTWGGFGGGKAAARDALPVAAAVGDSRTAAHNTTLVVGRPATPPETQARMGDGAEDPGAIAPALQHNEAGQSVFASQSAAQPGHTIVSQPSAQAVAMSDGGDYAFAPVTVEAARPNWEKTLSPGQVSVVYPEQYSGEQKDLPDLLDHVPGLFVQRVSGDGHYTVARVRGATGAQVNVYVDGVLMNLNGEAAVNLSAIPVDNVERVEVYRGYVPARFSGSPLGGVINIVTKKPTQLGGVITQGVKSYGGYTGSYQFTAPAGSGSLMATFQRDIWKGDFKFQNRPQGYGDKRMDDLYRRSNGYQNSSGMVKWQDDSWMVKAAWKQLHEQLPRSVSKVDNVEKYRRGFNDAEQDIEQTEFQIGRRATVGNLDWGWKLYYLDSDKRYRATGMLRENFEPSIGSNWPGFLWTDFQSEKWGVNLNTAWKLGSNHLLEFTFDHSRESLNANGSNWDVWDDDMTHLNRQFIRSYKIREYHLTLQDTITLNRAGDFKLTPVFRADRVEMTTLGERDQDWKYSGAAALQKQLNQHWSVKTSWGTYNRHPNFYELFGDGATIRPNKGAAHFFDVDGDGAWETGHQFDFGVNWQGTVAKADTDTNLSWFTRRAKNQLALWQPAVANAPGTYFSMDDARVHGIELTHSMAWERLTLNLAGTWQQSDFTNDFMGTAATTNGRKGVISYTPEWVWSVRLDYRFPGDKLSAFTQYSYTGKQFVGTDTSEEHGQFLQALSTVDLGLKYAFDGRWKLATGVNDVFNKGYDRLQQTGTYTTAAYPLAGRMYYATLECKF